MPRLENQHTLKRYLQEDLLGELPIFFQQCMVEEKEGEDAKRSIKVKAYSTSTYQAKPYHKVVSKII